MCLIPNWGIFCIPPVALQATPAKIAFGVVAPFCLFLFPFSLSIWFIRLIVCLIFSSICRLARVFEWVVNAVKRKESREICVVARLCESFQRMIRKLRVWTWFSVSFRVQWKNRGLFSSVPDSRNRFLCTKWAPCPQVCSQQAEIACGSKVFDLTSFDSLEPGLALGILAFAKLFWVSDAWSSP